MLKKWVVAILLVISAMQIASIPLSPPAQAIPAGLVDKVIK
ncbi:hypothetical protein [Mesorhizobium sp. M6A.T.Ce.TU.016.01.1.1]|nr:hypothetical protein [Mesorhizobium sp. M6A.T.Ce.TU.016.01.1.1]